jgi:hypothetical protein
MIPTFSPSAQIEKKGLKSVSLLRFNTDEFASANSALYFPPFPSIGRLFKNHPVREIILFFNPKSLLSKNVKKRIDYKIFFGEKEGNIAFKRLFM